MSKLPGIPKADIQSLPRIRDRISFIYVERCQISREDGAITITDMQGTVHIPAAMLGVLMIGPGSRISHRAIELIADTGTCLIWVGEQGVRYYAHGRSLSRSTNLLIRQAKLVSNTHSRLSVARAMYQMRFPGENVSSLTMQQLRGREGARIRAAYRRASEETGVPWTGREYNPDDFAKGDPVNQALSAAHACLYGLAHSAIVALGCSSGLGFIHTGHARSFVYDIADLYKAEITIPIAFEVAAESQVNIGSIVRRRTRDAFAETRLIERAVRDIYRLLRPEEVLTEEDLEAIYLWDDKGNVKGGISYGKEKIDELEEDSDENCEFRLT